MSHIENAYVQVDANVIRQLGDQLVTDAEQALLELVKNSYDADATWVHVKIDTNEIDKETGLIGVISVEDNGTGMSLDILKNGWLTVSLSPKREMKAQGKKTGKHRTPLGDKGLGRLASMKLGSILEIKTHAGSKKKGLTLSLDWNRFASGKTLKELPVSIDEAEPLSYAGTGTTVTVKALETPDYWTGAERAKSLESSLSRLMSPFEAIKDFKVSISLEGQKLNLTKLSKELRESATAHFSFVWDNETLICKGQVKLNVFRSGRNDLEYDNSVAPDHGASLYLHLCQERFAEPIGLELSKTGPWYIKFQETLTWEQIKTFHETPDFIRTPGPFRSEIDNFDLESEEGEAIFSSREDYKSYVKDHAGIHVYRNGFAIRMPDDWLGLSKEMTSGKSYYAMRPANTLGFVSITAAENQMLIEKSDRESFLDTFESRGFAHILGRCTKFANDSLSSLRRSAVKFKNARKDAAANLPAEWTPAHAAERLADLSRGTKKRKRALRDAETARENSLHEVQKGIEKLSKDKKLTDSQKQLVEHTLTVTNSVLLDWEARKNDMDAALSAIDDEGVVARAVYSRFEMLERQINEVYETVAIGLAAQAFAHDINALLDDLVGRTSKLAKQLGKTAPPTVAAYLEAVRAIVATLRRQLNYVEPMLQRARETRQTIKLADFVREFLELRAERLTRLGIISKFEVFADCTLVMNRGRLTQVLDNVVRNSEYWLGEKGAIAGSGPACISFELRSPQLTIADNGPGVRPGIESRIFDMFVSDKPSREASGLGLFIVQELLNREGCSISLAPDRNTAKRRFKFAVDFSGVVR